MAITNNLNNSAPTDHSMYLPFLECIEEILFFLPPNRGHVSAFCDVSECVRAIYSVFHFSFFAIYVLGRKYSKLSTSDTIIMWAQNIFHISNDFIERLNEMTTNAICAHHFSIVRSICIWRKKKINILSTERMWMKAFMHIEGATDEDDRK